MEWEVITSSAGETQKLGALIGSLAVESVTIFLFGELGTGKTCLTRGIGQSLAGGEDVHVSSPSYTLMNLYPGRINLYHFDLYRLSGVDDLEDIGFEDYLQEEGVIVVEWADRAEDLIIEGLFIRLQHLDESRRRLVFTARGEKHQKFLRQLSELWPEGRKIRD
jgi:tRNA threonylcarbamoyladenosine biosynthesis protein TsaE